MIYGVLQLAVVDTVQWIVLGAVAVLGLIAAVGVYYGVQSVKQAALLKNVVPHSALPRHEGQCVAVTGKPKLEHDLAGDLGTFLWIETRFQEYRRGSRNQSGWHTVDTKVRRNPFVLGCAGGDVRVLNQATEVHGTEMTRTDSAGGRTIRTFLPASAPSVTVVGLLLRDRDGWVLKKDEKVGMLLTGGSAGSQAKREAIKGWGGVVVLPVLWLLGLAYAYSKFYY